MTVVSNHNTDVHIGNGETSIFPFTFKIFDATDLIVSVMDNKDNVSYLILNQDYTVKFFNNSGEITLRRSVDVGYNR